MTTTLSMPTPNANANANATPFPVALSSEDRSRFIVNQRLVIASLINQFWVHREVHYTTINSTFEVGYQASLFDLLQLDLLIYEIVYSRERFQLYLSYIQNFPGGSFTPVRKHRFDIPDEDDEEHDYEDDKEDDEDNEDYKEDDDDYDDDQDSLSTVGKLCEGVDFAPIIADLELVRSNRRMRGENGSV